MLALAMMAVQPPAAADPEAALTLVHHRRWHTGSYYEASAMPQLRRRRSQWSLAATPGMSSQDRSATREWRVRNPDWTPPPAPAGSIDRLRPGHPFPSDVARTAPPVSLAARLPSHPNHAYVVVGSSLVLLDRATHVVVDVLWDVFKT